MDLLVVASGEAAKWSSEPGPGAARGVLARNFWWLLGLLTLEAAAGIATAGLVVLFGVSQPGWIDEPLGWLLVGLVGPAVAAATILKVSIGGTDFSIGLSLLYVPLREWLAEPLDNGFHTAGLNFGRRAEAIYRQRADEAFDARRLTLEMLIRTLKAMPGERLGETAFVVSRRYLAAIESDLGKLEPEDLKRVEAPTPPRMQSSEVTRPLTANRRILGSLVGRIGHAQNSGALPQRPSCILRPTWLSAPSVFWSSEIACSLS